MVTGFIPNNLCVSNMRDGAYVGRWVHHFLLLLCLLLPLSAEALTSGELPANVLPNIDSDTLLVFVREGCPHCAAAKQFLPQLSEQRPGLHIVFRSLDQDPTARVDLINVAQQAGIWPPGVPTFVMHNKVLVGFEDDEHSGAQLAAFVDEALHLSHKVEAGWFGTISVERLGLPLFTLAMGLLDGFNPCSMWVLILMISLLAPMQNRARMLAVAGTFVAVEAIAYFLFMSAWLNLFLFIGLSRVSEIVIALIAIVAGAINLKDFWAFGWGGVTISIPQSAKPGIYQRMRGILQAPDLWAAIIGSVVLAVLVQIVELFCTSGFPALYTRILTMMQPDAVGYYAYLLLYNLAYMFDDIAVLAIGVVTLSQRRLQENEGRWLKLISGTVMILLGLYLLLIAN